MANRVGVFITTVTTSGTQVRLSTSDLLVHTAIVQAEHDNTGYIVVGGADVDYATGLGISLGVPAADGTPPSVVFSSSRPGSREVNLADIWIDAETNGDGVKVMYSLP